MCKQEKYFICKLCGNLVSKFHDSGVALVCCGEEMTELVVNTVEASAEKHIPVCEVNGNTAVVTIGSVLHPMIPEHSILWIVLKTTEGTYRKCLSPGEVPTRTFTLAEGEKVVSVLEYCNLHGLWALEL